MALSVVHPIERVPPHSMEAEAGVLGAFLLNNEIFPHAAELLDKDDFYRTGHRILYEAMCELSDRGEPIDVITVVDILRGRDLLDKVGGAAYVAELTGQVPSAERAVHYARIVRKLSILRKLITTAQDIADKGYGSQSEVDEFLDSAEQSVFEVTARQVRPSFSSLKEMLKHTFKTIEDLHARRDTVTGVPTGFYQLDELTAGLQPSDLIIVAGRPAMGKTSFALNLAQYAAGPGGVPVGVFSLEMSKEQLVMRLLASEAEVDSQKLRRGMLAAADWPKLTRAAGILNETPIFIDDTPALSTFELRAKARRLVAEHKVGLIVVDYLQLMRSHGSYDVREQEISEISRSLKGLAKELHIPVVALSQLNRSLESREDKRPQLSDLRESGAIEQDADVIMFVFREEVYHRKSKKKDAPHGDEVPAEIKGVAEIIVGKQRNGPTGDVRLFFDNRYTRFRNLDTQHSG